MHKLSIHLDGLDEGVETLQWKTATSPASTIHGNSNGFLQKPTHQIPSLHILTVWTAVHTNGLLQPTWWAMAYRQKNTQKYREVVRMSCITKGVASYVLWWNRAFLKALWGNISKHGFQTTWKRRLVAALKTEIIFQAGDTTCVEDNWSNLKTNVCVYSI